MSNPSALLSQFINQASSHNSTENGNQIIYARWEKFELAGVHQHMGIHYVLEGSLQVRLDLRTHTLEAGQFLLINEGQDIQISQRNKDVPTEILWINLNPAWLAAVHQESIQNCYKALGEHRVDKQKLEVYEHIYAAENSDLGELLHEIGSQFREGNVTADTLIDDLYETIGERLIELQCQVFKQLQRLTSSKLSTKKELYRRLCKAKSFIHNHLDSTLDLDTLAQVACLSKYHFIRLFKEAFDETPRQYLIKKRLETASQLLISSDKSFHEICQDVGLKDSSSFGRLFKRNFGATPHLYRRKYALK